MNSSHGSRRTIWAGSRGCRQRSGDRRSDDAGHGSDHQDAEKDGTIEEQDINRPTISKKITKINPSLFPMDTILREIETVPCKSVEYQYYSVRGRGVQSKIKRPTPSPAKRAERNKSP